MPNKCVVNTSRRIYWFDDNLLLHEITDTTDLFFDVIVEEPVNEGQFRNLYIRTDNYRHPKKWDGLALEVSDLGGLADIGVIRAATMEINNSHVIFGNIAKNGGGPGASNPIDSIGDKIDTVLTIIDAYGTTEETGYKRFNKTVVWSDINRPEYYLPEQNNQAGDLDFDEDGFQIVRIKRLSELNVVYKERSIWLLIHVGLPFVYVKKFHTDDIGLFARNAIYGINNTHYFVGHDLDIYRFDAVSLANLSASQNIKEYIRTRIRSELDFTTTAYGDLDRHEVYFNFPAKPDVNNPYPRFEIVYNYQNNTFSKRDSVANCGGYFSPKKIDHFIDEFSNTAIDKVNDLIDDFGIDGMPARKLLIGDSQGLIHFQNHGDTFDGKDINGYFESGDEDYAEVSRGQLSNVIKMISLMKILMENQGLTLDLFISVGTRDSFDAPIRWSNPVRYKQDGSENGRVNLRANGIYHRYKITAPKGNQFVRILGFVNSVQKYGESRR